MLSKRVDAALADTYNIGKFSEAHPEVRDLLPGKPYSVLPAAWSVRYSDLSLWLFLNNALAYLEGNGILTALDAQYKVPNEKPR